jgi:hypothetical protein
MSPSDLQTYASITHVQEGHVRLHSTIPMYIPSPPVSEFEQTIRHFTNQSLWVSLEYNGDGLWILDSMLAQSLIIIHDGSYMKEISPDISSEATMIYCLITRYQCKCTWAEHSTSAGSYCGEILGRIMSQLILNAASFSYEGAIPPVVVDCDNNGIVSHGNAPHWSLPTNQPQANVLGVFKYLVSIQPFPVKLKYVQSHADKTKKWQDCPLKDQINIKVDRLAKKALKAAHCTGQFIGGTFSFEHIWMTMGGKKITGPLCLELEESWGRSTARRFFNKKGIVLFAHFDTVWWRRYDRAISGYPKTFRTFITKQVSGWCGCNSKQSLWEDDIVNKCPLCGCKHENSKHLTQCRDPGRELQL